MVLKDVVQVVAVHLTSFPNFFLSFLGPRFLTLYYSGICSDREGMSFVYLDSNDQLLGFVAGSSNPRKFYSHLLKRDWLRFSFFSMGAIIKRPTVIRRIFRALYHPSENPVGDDIAGLFSIGVVPECQGIGVGKKLIEEFLDKAKKRGCKRVFLTTDHDQNDTVNSFYQKLGFNIERQYVMPEGRRMNEYWINV